MCEDQINACCVSWHNERSKHVQAPSAALKKLSESTSPKLGKAGFSFTSPEDGTGTKLHEDQRNTCCVSWNNERPTFSLASSGSARTLFGDRSPSSVSLAVSVAPVGTFFAGPGLWGGAGGAKELEPIRKQYLHQSICHEHASNSILPSVCMPHVHKALRSVY